MPPQTPAASFGTASQGRTVTWPVAAALLLVFLVALAPLLATPLPANDDFLNHLARCYVISLHGSDPLLDRFYAIEWKLVPNLAIDLIVPPLASVFGLFIAGKLFMLTTMLLLLSGPQAVYYALHRCFSIGPMMAALFIYSRVDRLGVANYEFGVGLAMWAVALWITLRQASPLRRSAVSALCVVALFLCHLGAVVIYGLAIASVDTERLWSRRAARRILAGDLAAMLLPFVLAFLLLRAGPQAGDVPHIPSQWGGLYARIDGIRYALESFYWQADIVVIAGTVVGLGWLLWRGVLKIPVHAWVFTLLGGTLFMVIPNTVMGSWGAAVRLPVGLLFVLIGLLRWEFASPRTRIAFLVGLILLVGLRSAEVGLAYYRYDLVRRDFEASLPLIAPGSRVLVARDLDSAVASMSSVESLPSLVMIKRSSMDSLAFSHPLQQVLTVKPPYRESTGGYGDSPISLSELLTPSSGMPPPNSFDPSGRNYWKDWQRNYDYVYILERKDRFNPAPNRLDLLYDGNDFQLFRVRRA
jgi:hypothetical protein